MAASHENSHAARWWDSGVHDLMAVPQAVRRQHEIEAESVLWRHSGAERLVMLKRGGGHSISTLDDSYLCVGSSQIREPFWVRETTHLDPGGVTNFEKYPWLGCSSNNCAPLHFKMLGPSSVGCFTASGQGHAVKHENWEPQPQRLTAKCKEGSHE